MDLGERRKQESAELAAQLTAGFARFGKFVPLTDDTLSVVLKGHMFIEEGLLQLAQAGVEDKAALGKLKGFTNRLTVARAVVGSMYRQTDELWNAVQALDHFRNCLAHQLDAKADGHETAFLDACARHDLLKEWLGDTPKPGRTRGAITLIWTMLAIYAPDVSKRHNALPMLDKYVADLKSGSGDNDGKQD